jgi:RPA family protein
MSANGDDGEDGDSGPGTREVAYRLFAAEFEDCDFQFSESDEERAPNYVITPSGGRVNRVFLTGVLTELEQVNETMLRARIVDPTGAFVVYAGQYQPEALSFLERAEPPAFLAVTGKARTYQPDDSEVVYSSVRPESISEVDAETRDRWVVSTAEQTLDRIGVLAAAIDAGLSGADLREQLESEGVDPALAQGVALARDHYGTTPAYLDALRDLALDATRVVANERDEAGTLDLAPDEGSEADVDALRADGPELGAAGESEPTTADRAEATETTTAGESATPSVDPESATEPETSTTATAETEARDESTTAATTGADPSEPTEPGEEPAVEEEITTASEPASAGDEPTAEPADDMGTTAEPSATDDGDDLGDFEPGEFDEEPEEDPLGDDVREQVEEEYGTEFSTGTEVESEPDLEPDAEPTDESEATDEPEPSSDPAGEVDPDTADEPAEAEEPTDEPAEDVDLSEAVMDAMRDLDEGDGAPTDAVIDRVVDRTGASADEVDEAVQEALMGGQCYEPEDGTLKPI